MSTVNAYLTVAGIDVDVVYKDIKNLHIGVYPPMGRVRVAAPRQLDDDQIRLAVIGRLPWIKKRRDELRTAERESKREMVTGESHYVWGIRHRLKVVERPGRAHLEVDGERLLLYVPEDTPTERRLEVLDQWYRVQLRASITSLIPQWEVKLNVSVPRWSIRRMKTKWGSCNRATGHLWFNIELARRHPRCLEYIILHEMTHLLERNHTERFSRLMTEALPDWQSRRDELNAAPLSYQEWRQ
jgi:predicted metal-dependent hydrolase